MEVQSDFRELLELLNEHEVDYLIIGGYALAFHGAPRYTGDLDIFVRPDSTNAQKIIDALNEFGFESVGLTLEDFQTPDKVVQLGVPPVRIDFVTSISGVALKEVFSHRVDGKYGDVPVKYIGREEFILNKGATGRKKDLADLEALGEE